MRLIESNLREVQVDEYMKALEKQELMLNLTFDNGLKASVAMSSKTIYVEMMEPQHKFFVGHIDELDFKKVVKKHAEEVKKALKLEEGISNVPVHKLGG